MGENPSKSFRSAARHVVLSVLRACCILMTIFGTLGVPFGAFIGAESGHDGPGPRTAAEAKAKKKWAYEVMAASAFMAIAGATALCLAGRRQCRKNTQDKIEFARQIHPPKRLPESQNEPLLSSDSAPEPFQFRLRSIFLATSAVVAALGVLMWLGPFYMILPIQCGAVIAILVKSKGTAWRGVLIGAKLGDRCLWTISTSKNFSTVPFFRAWPLGLAEELRRTPRRKGSPFFCGGPGNRPCFGCWLSSWPPHCCVGNRVRSAPRFRVPYKEARCRATTAWRSRPSS